MLAIAKTARELAVEHLTDDIQPKRMDVVKCRCSKCRDIVDRLFKSLIRSCSNRGCFVCRSCSNREIARNPEVRNKIRKTARQRSGVASEVSKRLWQNDDYRKKVTESSKRFSNQPAERLRRSIRTKHFFSDPTNREMMRQKSKESYKPHDITKEIRDKLSEATRNNWKKPKLRAKYLKGSQKAYKVALSNRCSSLNEQVYSTLTELNVPFEKEYPIGPYSFDVYLPKTKTLIEIQGEYWHNLPKNKTRDKTKATYIRRYHEDKKLCYIQEIEFGNSQMLINKLAHLADVYTIDLDFSFDDVAIGRIETIKSNQFLERWHYLHKSKPGQHYGAQLEGELIAACVFSHPTREEMATRLRYESCEILELSRLCIHPFRHKKNFASFFVSKCMKRLPSKVKAIVAFSDTTYGHKGTVYKALGWQFDGEVKPDYWYKSDNGWVYHKKTIYNRARKLSMTEREYVELHGLVKQMGDKKLRFVWRRNGR